MPITVQRKKNDVGSKIIYNTEVLKSNLCDYNNGYILVRDNITVTEHQANFAPFLAYITKIDEATIDDPEDLHLVMTIYNLIEYSSH